MNNCCEELNGNPPSRQARLEEWFVRLRVDHGKTKTAVAQDLGLRPQHLSMVLKGDRMTKERHEQLVAYGIPAELLPEPRKPKPRGPRRCSDCPYGSA